MRVALLCCGILLPLAASSRVAFAAEASALEKYLEQPIIGPQVTLSEVQDFAEARIPRMPVNPTAEQWQQSADGMRQGVLQLIYRGEAARWRDANCGVTWQDTIDGGPGYRIRKLAYEALPGLWIPALLYEPEKLTGRVPVALHVNGHDGAGKAAGYKQIRSINLARRGMLVLNVEWLGMGQLRTPGFTHTKMNQLDLCGTAGIAPFYLAMKRGLDVLLAHEHADPARVEVAGLSGGGWQTIFISSLDTRVTLANPVAGYSSFFTRITNFSDLGDSEQTPSDLATVADYAHLTAMLAPRAALLTFNSKDNCCFASGHALPPLWEAAEPIYRLLKVPDRLASHVNDDPGNHNFERDNRQALYNAIGRHFFPDDKNFSAQEIDCQAEVKKAEELAVRLPENNLDFHQLALALMKPLPREAALPLDAATATSWQAARRRQLAEVVRYHAYDAMATATPVTAVGDCQARQITLRIGKSWTVPAVEFTPSQPLGTTLLLADVPRAKLAETCQLLLKQGRRVVVVEPLYFGEGRISQKDWLFALVLHTVGQRTLGLQASQTAAVARWLVAEYPGQSVEVRSMGPLASLQALVAAALEPQAISQLITEGSYASLKEVIDADQTAATNPTVFCFGLLEQFDICQMAALVAPRPVTLVQPGETYRADLAPLSDWYRRLGSSHQPLAAAK